MSDNLILMADSYKYSHPWQFPKGMTYMHDYVESRGGRYGETVFFGLQYYLKRYLSQQVTMEMVDEAREVLIAHGVPFDYDGWKYIVEELDGYIPVRIRAVPEGMVIPNHNVLMTVESTDERVPWVVGWAETLLLKVWYPTTVATQSRQINKIIRRFLEETQGDTSGLPFKLHDFGFRGVSSNESAGIGGLAHLVNFMGTDTVEAILYGRRYYNEVMAGFSIPAAEHSTITSWGGQQHEVDAFRNMVEQFPSGLVAVVSDSYDIFNAVDTWGTELKEMVTDRDGLLVVRPDSGDPVTVVLRVARGLDKYFGSTINEKGYKVLNHVRIIQGDGVNEDAIYDILKALKHDGFSAENIAFGMGGALLQGNAHASINRDTHRFAMKCSYVVVDGEGRNVFKDPVTDKGKVSKIGRLELIERPNVIGPDRYLTVPREEVNSPLVMRTVFENGRLLVDDSLADIRQRVS